MKTATERTEWLAIHDGELEECGRCGTEGIEEALAEPRDEEYTELLNSQTDGDSKYHQQLLCVYCMGQDDYRISEWNSFVDHHGRSPTPWEL